MKIVIAIDSFKRLSVVEVEANRAATEGILSVCPDAEIVQVPVSDGGEGFLEAFHAALGGELQGNRSERPMPSRHCQLSAAWRRGSDKFPNPAV